MTTFSISRDGLADLALPMTLEERLRDAIDANPELTNLVEAAINARLAYFSRLTDHTDGWDGEWSAEPIVKGILDDTTTYTAAIATAPDCVAGDFADVQVYENEITGYFEDGDGEEQPEYGMTSYELLPCTELDVRVDDEDKLGKVEQAADKVLAANGWARIEDWDYAPNALYARVVRA